MDVWYKAKADDLRQRRILYELYFYKDKDGKEPVKEYFRELEQKGDKDSRIKCNKIRDYMKILQEYGTQAGEPYIKHLDGEIWELRPIRDRILFAAWYGGGTVARNREGKTGTGGYPGKGS